MIHGHINRYGSFRLDLDARLPHTNSHFLKRETKRGFTPRLLLEVTTLCECMLHFGLGLKHLFNLDLCPPAAEFVYF